MTGIEVRSERGAERRDPVERLDVERQRARMQFQADPQVRVRRGRELGNVRPVRTCLPLPLLFVDPLEVGQPAACCEVR